MKRIIYGIVITVIMCKDSKIYDIGDVIWEADANMEVVQPPAIGSNGWMYLVSVKGGICYYDLNGENIGCDRAYKGKTFAAPVIWYNGDGRVILAGGNGTIYAYDKWKPRILWKMNIGIPVRNTPALNKDSTLYITAGDYLYKMEVLGGRIRWRRKLCEGFSPSIGARDKVYVSCKNGEVIAIDTSGNVLWEVRLNRRIMDRVIVHSDTLNDYALYVRYIQT